MTGLSGKPTHFWFPGVFWEANSVADFWSKWNPFIHYECLRFLRWVRRLTKSRELVPLTVFGIFLFSGFMHDFMIWLIKFGRVNLEYYWTIFFLLNGLVVIVERAQVVRLPLPRFIKKILTFCWLAASLLIAGAINDFFLH